MFVIKGGILLQNLTLGQYYPSKSLIHRLDPRTKLLTLLPIIIAITVRQDFIILSGLLLFIVVLVGLSKVPAVLFLRQLRVFIWIVAITFLIHAFITQGTAVARIPVLGFGITSEGLIAGFYFGFRLLLVLSFSVLLMFTTAPTEFTDGMEKLLRPLNRVGLNTDKYAIMLGITLRFIPILFEEGERIRKAQRARGAHFGGSLIAKVRSLASIVLPLFISVFKRADALALALEARGFPSVGKRTYFKELRFHAADAGAFFVVFVITSGVFLL